MTTEADPADAAVASFLKEGLKRELEVDTAAFVMKWLMDRDVPFSIDFESATVDRDAVLGALPRRLQKVLGYKATATTEAGAGDEQGEESGERCRRQLKIQTVRPLKPRLAGRRQILGAESPNASK